MTAKQNVIGIFFIVTAYILVENIFRNGLNKERNCIPGGQYRLGDESTNDKHDAGVIGCVFAAVFMEL